MPSSPLRFCASPGCPRKVPHGRCTEHRRIDPVQRTYNRRFQTGSTSYGRPWMRLRNQHITEHPFCVECEKEGHTRLAEVVDHITPHRGNRALMYDPGNLQSLCKLHHDRKTQAETRAGQAG